MNTKYEKSKSYNEPDEIMLLTDDEFVNAYDTAIEITPFAVEDEINDLIYQKEELENDIKNMQFILNNETVDFYRANELFDEIKFNQIEILRIEERIAKLKAKYDKITGSYQR